MPMMFCTGFRRDVYEKVGGLDERYEVGMFEDEDEEDDDDFQPTEDVKMSD